MADNTHDIRTKVGEREHQLLTAVSLATGRDISDIVRGLIAEFSDKEIHRARTVLQLQRGVEGMQGSERA